MKPQNKYSSKGVPSKGERLNWGPLKEVRPVVLKPEHFYGRRPHVSHSDNNRSQTNLLVP